VELVSSGVCATDLYSWLHATPGANLRLGHEPAGIVRAVGVGLLNVTVGDRVTGRFGPAYADYVLAKTDEMIRVPDNVPLDLVLGEPLGCLVEAERRTGARLGDTIAVVGLGFMGLGMLSLLAKRGPSRLVAIDVRRDALDKAEELGATEAYTTDEVPANYRVTDFAKWEMAGGFDVVVEASGTQAGLAMASDLVRAHGVLSILGFHQGQSRTVDIEMWNWKAINVVNAHVRRQSLLSDAIRAGLQLMAAGQFSFAPLVTHRFDLGSLDSALAALRDKPPGFVKAVIDFEHSAEA
jgi:threonine dehydrogenase-like Zn-dependent dehydrogenase